VDAVTPILVASLGVAVVVALRQSQLRRRLKRRLANARARLDFALGLIAHDAHERLRREGRDPTWPVEFRGMHLEDLVLYALVRDLKPGTYFEAGAHDGTTSSITRVLDALGWRGLLVEAIPERARQCRESRPGSAVEHAALGPPGSAGTTTFTVVEGSDAKSFRDESLLRPGHRARRFRSRWRRVTVPYSTAAELLQRHGFERLDVAVVDVEGGELPLLEGMDLPRHRPRLLLVEDVGGGDDKVRRLLDGHAYDEALRVGNNTLFIARDEPELLARARALAPLVRF
jgi:FkbM family methyltransferase